MKTESLNKLIELVKEIDKCLDAYEYNGYTFEEYNECIKKNIPGSNSIRHAIKYNSKGSHIWTNYHQQYLDDTKKFINKLYLMNKHNNKWLLNNDDILTILKKLETIKDTFKKNTDDCTLFYFESTKIIENLNQIINIIKNIYEERK